MFYSILIGKNFILFYLEFNLVLSYLMPFITSSPTLLDFNKSTPNLTIIPMSRITNTSNNGYIYQPTEITIIQPSLITSNTEGTLDVINTNTGNNGIVITDNIYELLEKVMINLSNPVNLEEKNLEQTVLPYLDELQFELDKYPDVLGLILEIQQVFKNILNTIKKESNLMSDNLKNIVPNQLKYLVELINKIPTELN